jgi:hypothetical protein
MDNFDNVAEFPPRNDGQRAGGSGRGLSVNTVRAHLREVFSKLGVNHRGQLVDRLGLNPDPLVAEFEI